MTFSLCVLAPLIRCHELLTLSASFTESTVSTRNRFGTPGNTKITSFLYLKKVQMEQRVDNHLPKSLLTLFFWRWPIKCHFISGHEFKIWKGGGRLKLFTDRLEKVSTPDIRPTRGSEALSTSSLTWLEIKKEVNFCIFHSLIPLSCFLQNRSILYSHNFLQSYAALACRPLSPCLGVLFCLRLQGAATQLVAPEQ